MLDSNSRPYISLIIGIFLTGSGVMSTLSGEALGRYGRMVRQAEDPNKFRRMVAVDYLGGAFCIGYFLYKAYILSN